MRARSRGCIVIAAVVAASGGCSAATSVAEDTGGTGSEESGEGATTGNSGNASCDLIVDIFDRPERPSGCVWPEVETLCPDEAVPFPDRVVPWGEYVVVDFEADGVWDVISDRGNGWRVVRDVFGTAGVEDLEVPPEAGNAFSYDLTGDGILDVVFVTPEGLVAHEGGQPPVSLTATVELPLRDETNPRETAAVVGNVDGNGGDDAVLVWMTLEGWIVIDVLLDSGVVLDEQVFGLRENMGFWTGAMGDVNGDGLDDVILSRVQLDFSGWLSIAVLINTGGGQFADPEILPPPPGAGEYLGPAAVADLDGDGRAEIVVAPQARYDEPVLDVWSLEASGWAHTKHPIPPLVPLELADAPPGSHTIEPVATVIASDLDGDGDNDLVLAVRVNPILCGLYREHPAFYVVRNDEGALTPVKAVAPYGFGYETRHFAPTLLPDGDLLVYLQHEARVDGEPNLEGALLYHSGSFLP